MNRKHPKPSSRFAVVVNDDPTQLSVLAGLVRKAGLEPRTFTGAEDALTDMTADAVPADGVPGALPALVVTDLYMPGLDGWRFCRLLRSPEYADFNKVPILVVSATYAGDEADRIAADLGADAFLPAAVDGARFVERVRAILGGKRVRTPLRVLIVEDSVTLARILDQAFVTHGYQTDMALTARAGTDAFQKTAYDVALLDYHLPDGQGDALLDQFQATRPDCVCLMMTTDPGPELALDWMKRGAAAYLRKPFEPDYLIELCAKARRERALLRIQDLLDVRTRELRESEERYRQLFESASDALLLIACDTGLVVEANSMASELYGYDRDELLSRTSMDLSAEPEEARRHLDEACTMPGVVVSVPSRLHRKKDGTVFPVEITARSLSVNGRPILLVATRDVTEKQRAEEEKAKLEGHLRQAQKMESVGRLAGGVAHDFNNMLVVILGHTEMALDQVDPADPLHADLVEIRKAASRSADLTRQLLAFARKQTVAPRVLDLNETVTGILKMIERLIGEDIHLNWQPKAGLWPIRVDPSQIDQILANLCVNARDAITGVGKMTIETGNTNLDEDYCAGHAGFVPGDYVRLVVSDDGCGMDKDTLSHLFEPFFTTKVMGEGTGLGLATVYGIVKQNNGFINVYSEPSSGTTFTIYLPRHAGKTEQTRTEGAARPAPRGEETILLVEDEPAILTLATTMLKRQGYTVLAASTPGEAIRLAREYAGQIHLLMTDVVMPEMNGRALARNLASVYPRIKRLFMSGYTANVIAHHGVLDDGVSFLQKPFSMNDLAAGVREALERE